MADQRMMSVLSSSRPSCKQKLLRNGRKRELLSRWRKEWHLVIEVRPG